MLCAVALLVAGSSKKPVERPFKEYGVISFAPDGTFDVFGQATHMGRFVGHGASAVTGVSPDGLKVYFHVTATWTAADGSAIQIDMPNWVSDHTVTPATSTGVANVVGGTGRFLNATGSFFADISPADIIQGVPNILTADGTLAF